MGLCFLKLKHIKVKYCLELEQSDLGVRCLLKIFVEFIGFPLIP